MYWKVEALVVTSKPDTYVHIHNKEKQVIPIRNCGKLGGTMAVCF
jgi:hypothetical protein